MLHETDIEQHLKGLVKAYAFAGAEKYAAKVASCIIKGPARSTIRSIFSSPATSTRDKETYTGLGIQPKARRWRETPGHGATEEFSVTIENVDWIVDFSVHEKAIRRNQLQGALFDASQMGEAREFLRDERALEHLVEGRGTSEHGTENQNGYDGKPLISTTHRKGDSTQSNKPAAVAFSDAKFMEYWNLMVAFKDPLDRHFAGRAPKHLMVGRTLNFTAIQVITSTLALIANGAGTAGAAVLNPISAYNVEISCVAHSDVYPSDAWHLIDNTRSVAAVIDQEEKAPQFRSNLGDPNDPERRKSGKCVCQEDWAGDSGVGEWMNILRGK